MHGRPVELRVRAAARVHGERRAAGPGRARSATSGPPPGRPLEPRRARAPARGRGRARPDRPRQPRRRARRRRVLGLRAPPADWPRRVRALAARLDADGAVDVRVFRDAPPQSALGADVGAGAGFGGGLRPHRGGARPPRRVVAARGRRACRSARTASPRNRSAPRAYIVTQRTIPAGEVRRGIPQPHHPAPSGTLRRGFSEGGQGGIHEAARARVARARPARRPQLGPGRALRLQRRRGDPGDRHRHRRRLRHRRPRGRGARADAGRGPAPRRPRPSGGGAPRPVAAHALQARPRPGCTAPGPPALRQGSTLAAHDPHRTVRVALRRPAAARRHLRDRRTARCVADRSATCWSSPRSSLLRGRRRSRAERVARTA